MDRGKTQVPRGPFKFLLFVSKPHWIAAILAIVAIIIASSIDAVVPYLFKRIIESINVTPGLGPESVWFWAWVYIVFSFLAALMRRASGFAGMYWSTGVRATARERLSEHVTLHSYGFFSDRFAGALGSKINNASNGARQMVGAIVWDWLGFIVHFAIALILAIHTSIYIGLVLIAWLLVVTPFNIYLVKRKIPLGFEAQQRETELRGNTVDVLTNINAMHDYARRAFEMTRLRELINIRRLAGVRNWSFSEWTLLGNHILEAVFVGGMIIITVHLFDIGRITAGDIILILSVVVSIRGDIARIGRQFNDAAEVISETKEGLDDILHSHEIVDAPLATELRVSDGEIVFDQVSFRYEKQDIFTDLNVHIKAGERVGLVGRSGAGKSTLMKLLTRQYDVTGGKILIDGQDIALATQESLRASVAIVPQDPLLFHRSLRDNIRYGKLMATDEDIAEAAKHAQAHDFIDKLPDGYETLVGERGVKLSGGERQRVAIARAFLKDAKVLLLDEATSSLDSEGEMMIQKALGELMKGKTVIAIAHRLSTLRAMDRILVLDQGQVIEDGTHNELLKQGGIYAELWSHQAGGFLQDE